MNLLEHFNTQNTEDTRNAWSNNTLLYRNLNLFDIYIEGAVADKIREAATTWGLTAGEVLDGQEVYLGYHREIKSIKQFSFKEGSAEDRFISGWDLWGNEGIECAAVSFRLNDDGEVEILDVDRHSFGFYDRHRGIYRLMTGADKKYEQERLDIRLD